MAASRRQEMNIARDVAAALGRSAVQAAREGFYVTKAGQQIVWRDAVQAACAAKISIAPDTSGVSQVRQKDGSSEVRIRSKGLSSKTFRRSLSQALEPHSEVKRELVTKRKGVAARSFSRNNDYPRPDPREWPLTHADVAQPVSQDAR
jgi:hypothetical protein